LRRSKRYRAVSAGLQRQDFVLFGVPDCHHDDARPRRGGADLPASLHSAHPRHVDIGQDQNQRGVAGGLNALQRRRCRLGKFHGETTAAQIPPELLAKQRLNIGFVIDH